MQSVHILCATHTFIYPHSTPSPPSINFLARTQIRDIKSSLVAWPFGDGRSQELKAARVPSTGHGLRVCMVRMHRPEQSYRGRRSSLERLGRRPSRQVNAFDRAAEKWEVLSLSRTLCPLRARVAYTAHRRERTCSIRLAFWLWSVSWAVDVNGSKVRLQSMWYKFSYWAGVGPSL